MRILCRSCKIELNTVNSHSHGFCIECTGNDLDTAYTLDEQYTRIDQDLNKKIWDTMRALTQNVLEMRTEVRLLLESAARKGRRKTKKPKGGKRRAA